MGVGRDERADGRGWIGIALPSHRAAPRHLDAAYLGAGRPVLHAAFRRRSPGTARRVAAAARGWCDVQRPAPPGLGWRADRPWNLHQVLSGGHGSLDSSASVVAFYDRPGRDGDSRAARDVHPVRQPISISDQGPDSGLGGQRFIDWRLLLESDVAALLTTGLGSQLLDDQQLGRLEGRAPGYVAPA